MSKKLKSYDCLWVIGDEVQLTGGSPRMLVVDYGAPGDVVVAFRDSDGVHEFTLNKMMLIPYGSN